MRRYAFATLLAVAFTPVAVSAAEAPAYTKSAYAVPVTQPDETGAPVTIDTDLYVPTAPAPTGGRPLLVLFHGGGSNKDNGFDAGHAARFAARGYAVILYSQRGHGASSGQTAVAGPKEIRDFFDVLAWALRKAGRDTPPHPPLGVDESRIALAGYSQGGLHTNLGQVWSSSPDVNPYGFRFVALEPGNTPDRVFDALVSNQVVKLSFGLGLVGTYLGGTQGKIAPVVEKWIGTAGVDESAAYGGEPCDLTAHDTPTSTMRADLGWRSVGCKPTALALPWHWAQAFDDELFTPHMALSMWRRTPHPGRHHLYLSMGGHGAPAADRSVEEDKLVQQINFLDAVMAGRKPSGPAVVYWTRDPTVVVPSDSYAYPRGAWTRQTSGTWPPAGVRDVAYRLSADGRATEGTAEAGDLPLQPITEDERTDPIAQAATSGTPVGTSLVTGLPATSAPGFVAGFRTEPFKADVELSGASKGTLAWTPLGSDTQVVLKLYDEAPDGTTMLISRGVTGLRGQAPLAKQQVRVATNTFSVRVHAGHRVLAWVTAGDIGFYKPYAPPAGGVLTAGAESTLTLPVRTPHASKRRHLRRGRRAD